MRRHAKAIVAVAALFAFLVLPASAFSKEAERVIDTGLTPGALAVNNTSGDLYVKNQTADRIQRYDATGNFIGQFGATGTGPGEFSFEGFGVSNANDSGLAIDQTDGSVYVADTGNNRIQKFAPDGTFVAMWGDGVNQTTSGDVCTAASSDTCGAGNPGSGDGDLSAPRGVAIDPSTANVYVADTGNSRVQRFSPAGAYQMQFSDQVSAPQQIAVDSTGRIYLWGGETFSPILRFSAGGNFDTAFTGFTSSNQIGVVFAFIVDPVTDNVFVSGGAGGAEFAVHELAPDGALLETHGEGLDLGALALPSSGDPLYAAPLHDRNYNHLVFVLTDSGPATPAVAIESVTDVGTATATFHGTVNPNGDLATNWHFEYSNDGSNWTSTAGGQVPAGTSAVSVEEAVEGLEPNTEYRVRLVATPEFSGQSQLSGEATFMTGPAAPRVKPLDAGIPSDVSAWLGAKVSPQNSATTYYIEYSTDPGFANGVSLPASKDASAGAGAEFLLVNRLATGLKPRTTYYLRVVATNVAGTTVGDPRSFETLATASPEPELPDGRVWEKVSPADKQGAGVHRGNAGAVPMVTAKAQAAASGDAVVYASGGKFGGDSGPANSQYLARRGPDGWSTEGLNPFHEPGFGPENSNLYEWFSSDLSKGLVSTPAQLNPGVPSGVQSLYLRDNQSGAYTTVSSGDNSTPKNGLFMFRAGSANGERIAFYDWANSKRLQEWSPDGGAKDVGVFPGGTPMGADIETRVGRDFSGVATVGLNPVSKDGSRLFFGAEGGLYVRENGTSTTLISASERSGDDPTAPRSAIFLAASGDGTAAFFTSDALLTDSSTGSGLLHLYRWDAEAPEGERLTELAAVEPDISGVFATTQGLSETGVGDDGESFYFATGKPPIGVTDTAESRPGLYSWQEGQGVDLIAELSLTDRGIWTSDVTIGGGPGGIFRAARVTPDGRYLAFSSTEALTAYDTNHKRQLYLYDREADQITCVSCSRFELKSRDHSWFLSCLDEDIGDLTPNCDAIGGYFSRNLSEDGSRFFFDSRDALVPEDTNGVTDLYEWSGGRLHLISSGTSSSYSSLIDASSDGDDVFFITAQQLVPSDKDDLYDLYDARVGGKPEPGVDAPCVADECQGTPTPPPGFQTPSSSGFKGEGNTKPARRRCRRGNVHRKGRCTPRKGKAKKHPGKSKRANPNRRTGR